MNPKKTRLWTNDFVVVFVENFIAALNFYLLMIVMSGYAMSKFNSSPGEAGFSASIFIIGGLIARLFVGKWIGQIGHKKTLYVGVILNLIMTLLYFRVNNIRLLFAVRFLHGMGFGITTTAAATIVANIIPMERKGEGIAYFGLSQILATAIGPFLGMLISQHGSFVIIFATCAVASAISLVILPFLSSLHEIKLTKEQLEKMKEFKFNNFFEPRVIPISVVGMFIFSCYSSVVSFLEVYSKEIHLVDAASFFFIVYATVILVSRPIIGRLFDFCEPQL